MAPLLSRREIVVWTIGFAVIAALLVAVSFASDDPDSALYAALSARLAEEPPSRWIAPEWWGHWDHHGLFREHPAGVFLLPTLLGAMGIPGVQAAYIVGIAAGIAAIVLIGWLTSRVTSAADGRVLLILLQLMPLAFIFRIRANHEYPMLVCLLVAIIGIDAVRRSWRWIWVTPLALCAAALVKAAFVAVPMVAVVWWILTNPRRVTGSAWRGVAALGVSVMTLAGTVFGYDALYIRVTGESFWAGYWARQMEPLTLGGTIGEEPTFVHHLSFYAVRLLWHPAPWSLTLLAAAWVTRRAWRARWAAMSDRAQRGLIFGLGFAATTVLMLTPASRFAERYIFSANYALATTAIVVTLYTWPRLRAVIERLDRRIPALPALCWTVLMLLRLALGPFLPRISS